ncbi:ABC transporter permease [Microbacterium lushaniae]|uniref:ABC transporter permease n=1 Tax=Microbacterium lushaniae TaxID=2614639 RepID=UPI001783E64E|nr:FtsX-like permease family protein [Microbacterium lushaniae]
MAGSILAQGFGVAFTMTAITVTIAAQASSTGASASDRAAAVAGGYLLSVMAVCVWFMAVVIVAGSAAFTVTVRRREIALLRTVGATPGQIRRMLLAEGLLTSLVAGVGGSLITPPLTAVLAAWLATRGMMPSNYSLPFNPAAVLAGCGFAVSVGCVGTVPSAWRSARIRPADAVRRGTAEGRGVKVSRVMGALLLSVPVVWLWSRTSSGSLVSTFTTEVLLVSILVILAPVIVPPLARLTLARSTGALFYAGRDLYREAHRSAAVATPVTLAVAIVFSVGVVLNAAQAGAASTSDPTDSSNMNPAFLALLVMMVTVYATIAVCGAVVASTSIRGSELVALRLVGETRAQTMSTVAAQTSAAVLTGAAVAVLVSLLSALPAMVGAGTGGVGALPLAPLAATVAVCALGGSLTSVVAVARGPAGGEYPTERPV